MSAVAFMGCGNSRGPREGELLIRAFEGGFGREWLYSALEEYREQNPEFRFHVEWDPNISSTITTRLVADSNLPDLFMTQPFNWRGQAIAGRLAPLDEVFESPAYYLEGYMYDEDGEPVYMYAYNAEGVLERTNNRQRDFVSVEDFVVDGFADSLILRRLVDGELVPTNRYIVPWSVNSSSLAYNERLLRMTATSRNIDGITQNGFWHNPPETTEQLQWLVADINTTQAAGGYTGIGHNRRIYPFVFPGTAPNWLTFLHTNWWAQYQGLDMANTPSGEGSWYCFWNFYNLDVFRQSGLIRGYDMLRTLFTNSSGSWANVSAQHGSMSTSDAQRNFVMQNAVMMPVGSWLQREMSPVIGQAAQFIQANDLRMMTLPTIEGARSERLNNADLGHFMGVPANALNVDLARDFLKFLSTRDQMVEFTKYTGMMRPFNYDPLALAPNYEWTPFTRDIVRLFTENTNFFEMSTEHHPFFTHDGLDPYRPTIRDVISELPSRSGTQIVEEITIRWINDGGLWSQWHAAHGLTPR